MISEFPTASRLPTPARITEQTWPEGTVPVVSIFCITYQHVNFIRDAIEGFLMQETTFPVEILIHDDASTDGTADIVREYQAKYPQLIRTVLQTENQYSQGNKPGKFLNPLVRGEFIALCEGDDYWTDPEKLQIQVSFLERHLEYSMCGHNAAVVDAKGVVLNSSKLPVQFQTDGSAEALIKQEHFVLTMSVVFRNLITDAPPEQMFVTNGDSFLWSLLARHGKFKYLAEIKPACYRVHDGGIWSSKSSIEKSQMRLQSFFMTYLHHKRTGDLVHAEYFLQSALKQAMACIPTADLKKEITSRNRTNHRWNSIWSRIRSMVCSDRFKSMLGRNPGENHK